jgi:hypothetical protein
MTEDDEWWPLRKPIEEGDGKLLLLLLERLIGENKPIPRWLCAALHKVVGAVADGKVRSWNDVLGKPMRKGRHPWTEQRAVELMMPIWERVEEARAREARARDKRRDKGEDIKAIFEAVGKDLGVSGGGVSRSYYKYRAVCELIAAAKRAQ